MVWWPVVWYSARGVVGRRPVGSGQMACWGGTAGDRCLDCVQWIKTVGTVVELSRQSVSRIP